MKILILLAVAGAAYGQTGAAQVTTRLGATGTVNRSVQAKLNEVVSVMDFGAKGDGVTNDTAAIQAAIVYMQTARAPISLNTNYPTILFPTGVYRHTGLTINGGLHMTGPSGSGLTATLLYAGTGTALTLTNPSGQFNNLRLISTSGATTGIDMQAGTEFYMSNVQLGQGTTSSFTNGIRVRSSALLYMDYITTTWCNRGILFDFDTSASSAVTVEHGNFFAASIAAIVVRDVGAVTIQNNWFEGIQSAILLDNTNVIGVASGLKVIDNSANLLTSFQGLISFTNPQFIAMTGTNVANAMIVTGLQVEKNNVGGSPGNYCNTLSTALTAVGNLDSFLFSENHWSGCSSAAVNADNRVYITAQNEILPGGVVEFSGAMYGTDLEPNTGGQLILNQYQAGSYLSAYTIRPITAADVSGVGGVVLTAHTPAPTVSGCGTGATIASGSTDRAGAVNVGTGSITSCRITWGTSFAANPIGTAAISFGVSAVSLRYSANTTFMDLSPADGATSMASGVIQWTFPLSN